MLPTEDILKLIEANRIMSDLIDRLALQLLQHVSVEEIEEAGILKDASRAAHIMKDYI